MDFTLSQRSINTLNNQKKIYLFNNMAFQVSTYLYINTFYTFTVGS